MRFPPEAPIRKQDVLAALQDGTYWLNGRGQAIPLTKINKYYAANIRSLCRRRLKPSEYRDTPGYRALGRIRRET